MVPEILQRIRLAFSTAPFLLIFQRLRSAIVRFFRFPARSKLPSNLEDWRELLFHEADPNAYSRTWNALRPFFEEKGFMLWNNAGEMNQHMPDLPGISPYAATTIEHPGRLPRFGAPNGLIHAVRRGKQDYVVRVMSAAGEDLDHVRLMRMLSASSDIFRNNNHILPMVADVVYDDIIFGVFPRVGGSLMDALFPMAGRSIEDGLYMAAQALEAVIYIHGKNIAHRDLYLDNFMVEWEPFSLLGQAWTRPRVYLLDFETAVSFSDDTDPLDRLCSGLPMSIESYGRPKAPELLVPAPSMHCPFLLDLWQFGYYLVLMFSETGIEDIDNLWPLLMPDNPTERATAAEVLQKLSDFIATVPPQVLQREFACSPIYI